MIALSISQPFPSQTTNTRTGLSTTRQAFLRSTGPRTLRSRLDGRRLRLLLGILAAAAAAAALCP
jgi:hypothetical protein